MPSLSGIWFLRWNVSSSKCFSQVSSPIPTAISDTDSLHAYRPKFIDLDS